MSSRRTRRSPRPRYLALAVALLASVAGVAAIAPSWADVAANTSSGANTPSGDGARTAFAALGDSYASGVGAGSYDPASGSCSRSPQSAAALWAAARPDATFSFVACAGHTTTDVLNSQLGALNASVTQVTLTIGGHDAGYTAVLNTCVQDTRDACRVAVREAESLITKVLPDRLSRTYAAIQAKAPRARLIVLGYPRLFELTPTCPESGMDPDKRRMINHAADVLAEVTAARAAVTSATFVDVRPAFAGHGVCSSEPFIHGLTTPLTDSFHPTAIGYRAGYLPALVSVTG